MRVRAHTQTHNVYMYIYTAYTILYLRRYVHSVHTDINSIMWSFLQVKVTCMQHGTVQIFPCGKWITGGQSGRKTEKVLHEEQSSKDTSSG